MTRLDAIRARLRANRRCGHMDFYPAEDVAWLVETVEELTQALGNARNLIRCNCEADTTAPVTMDIIQRILARLEAPDAHGGAE